jgi:hypothetical protein
MACCSVVVPCLIVDVWLRAVVLQSGWGSNMNCEGKIIVAMVGGDDKTGFM